MKVLFFKIIAELLITITVHELGHLLMGLALGRPICSVNIGEGPEVISVLCRGIKLRMNLLPISGNVVYAFRSKRRWKNIAVSASGPAANFFLGVFLMITTDSGSFGRHIAAFSIFVGIFNLIPRSNSDGAHIVKEMTRSS